MDGLIIEGVAGTGKSTIVSLLKSNVELNILKPNFEIIDEDQTAGEIVVDLRNEELSDSDRYSRLYKLLPKIKQKSKAGDFTILERFHPTYFALMPGCDLFEDFDSIMKDLNFGLVLLDLPNEKFLERSFFRPEMESQNWSKGLTDWYGSQDAAISAFIASQQRRQDFLQKTKLKRLCIDTSGRYWNSYVDSIVSFISK